MLKKTNWRRSKQTLTDNGQATSAQRWLSSSCRHRHHRGAPPRRGERGRIACITSAGSCVCHAGVHALRFCAVDSKANVDVVTRPPTHSTTTFPLRAECQPQRRSIFPPVLHRANVWQLTSLAKSRRNHAYSCELCAMRLCVCVNNER